jgi:hypothetical protein
MSIWRQITKTCSCWSTTVSQFYSLTYSQTNSDSDHVQRYPLASATLAMQFTCLKRKILYDLLGAKS